MKKIAQGIDPSTLYVVATPIGNLGDISLRALEILACVHVIAAEDTRHTRSLLNHFDIRARLVSLHEQNEVRRCRSLVARLEKNGFDYERAISDVVDLDAFYRFWAVEGLLGFWDG